MDSDQSAVAMLLGVIGAAFISAAAGQVTTTGSLRDRRAVAGGIAGVLLLGAGLLWSSLSSILDPRLVTSATRIASNFITWLVLMLLVWIYLSAYSVILLRQRNDFARVIKEDLIPFRTALVKWVIPRHMERSQIDAMRKYLAQFPSATVTMRQPLHDEEASSYRADIQTGLREAGWIVHVGHYNENTVVPEGLKIHETITQETALRRQQTRQPTPADLIQEALKQAGITVDGTGTGSGQDVQRDEVRIDIGKRRRDLRNAEAQPWPFKPS